MQGAETELDRQVLDLIKDPLTHMVRNSADHGLEAPEQRRAAGKPEQALIRLSAYHEGGYIIIRIADDGRGLNTAGIKAKAVAQGLVSEAEAEKLSENPDSQVHFRARLLHRCKNHQCLRPRRGHGCGSKQHRPDRRYH